MLLWDNRIAPFRPKLLLIPPAIGGRLPAAVVLRKGGGGEQVSTGIARSEVARRGARRPRKTPGDIFNCQSANGTGRLEGDHVPLAPRLRVPRGDTSRLAGQAAPPGASGEKHPGADLRRDCRPSHRRRDQPAGYARRSPDRATQGRGFDSRRLHHIT